jgi:2,4-dienoyl-CoA reductase-like NADH-dependent reductase (Old Yellow Enzyme family)
MNSQDFIDGGLTLEDALRVGETLEDSRIDAIELSGGTRFSGEYSHWRRGITSEEKEAYFRKAGKAFKEKLHVPLLLVGGIRSFYVADRLIEEGYANYVSMSRPLIREPGLIKRWASGDLRRAKCVSDNQCYGTAMAGEGIYCLVEKKERESFSPNYRQMG